MTILNFVRVVSRWWKNSNIFGIRSNVVKGSVLGVGSVCKLSQNIPAMPLIAVYPNCQRLLNWFFRKWACAGDVPNVLENVLSFPPFLLGFSIPWSRVGCSYIYPFKKKTPYPSYNGENQIINWSRFCEGYGCSACCLIIVYLCKSCVRSNFI